MTEIAQRLGVNKSAVSRHFRRHLEPAIADAGGSPALAWNVREKSRELAQRMEGMLNAITRDTKTGDISERELLSRWQAVRALSAETREWIRLHGQASGELGRESERSQSWAIQIVCPSTPKDGMTPRIAYNANADIEEIALVQHG
jgi:hypothetical protein